MALGRCRWLFVATVMLMMGDTLAGRFRIPVKVLDCADRPIEGATVTLSSCVNTPLQSKTDANGTAMFPRYNPGSGRDKKRPGFINFCGAPASRQCNLTVAAPEGVSAVFDTYVLPRTPKERVRDSCNCNVCGEFPWLKKRCPGSVGFPGCPGRSGRSAAIIDRKNGSPPGRTPGEGNGPPFGKGDDNGPPFGKGPGDDNGPPSSTRPGDDNGPPFGKGPGDDNGPPFGKGPGNGNGRDDDDKDSKKMVILVPKSCNVPFERSSCTTGASCENWDVGAFCENQACDDLTSQGTSFFFCSGGGAPEQQLSLTFRCPAEGTLSLAASAVQGGVCGAGSSGSDKLAFKKLVSGVEVPTNVSPAFELQLANLPCDINTTYSVTEDNGIILKASVQAWFYPNATSSP